MLKAVVENDVDGVRAAAAARGNIEVLDQSGRTPLLRAVADNNVMLAETLLHARANPNPAPPQGDRTAIDFALHTEGDAEAAQGKPKASAFISGRKSHSMTPASLRASACVCLRVPARMPTYACAYACVCLRGHMPAYACARCAGICPRMPACHKLLM